MPTQKIEFLDFTEGKITEILNLHNPPFLRDNPFRQLDYIEQYVREIQCKTIVIEEHYIDRDYMEDHSVFYSRNLFPVSNSCRRAHFFSLTKQEVQSQFSSLVSVGISSGEETYRTACADFSKDYLGFTVIKPLEGSPVGRTVLRCYKREAPGNFIRNFNCTLDYKTHLAGVELTVRGLAFQQQDVGVSACATTALWSALHKAGDFEKITPSTPAQITLLASQHALPYGRPMPSEGLSVDQMCQAAQSLGVPPNLFREAKFTTARGHLYSTLRSGFAPVLILHKEQGSSPDLYHAVAVAGMKMKENHECSIVAPDTDDVAGDMIAIYMHDDRVGPYLRADLGPSDTKRLRLSVRERQGNEGRETDSWILSHTHYSNARKN